MPDTAPTANSTARTFDQRRASAQYTASPRADAAALGQQTTSAGNPTPKQAMTMCQPSDSAICWRAAHRSGWAAITSSGAVAQ